MRLANEIAAGAMEHVQSLLRPGMRESEVGAMWNGWVHEHGTGFDGKVELAHGFSLAPSPASGIRTFTATGSRPIQERASRRSSRSGCVRTATGATTRRTSSPASSTRATRRARAAAAAGAPPAARRFGPVTAWPSGSVDTGGPRRDGYPCQPSHLGLPRRRRARTRAALAHPAGGGTVETGMVLAIEPGVYWPEGGGLRVEDNFLITGDGLERLCRFLMGSSGDDRQRQDLDRRAEPARVDPSRTRRSGSTTRPCATASRRSGWCSRRGQARDRARVRSTRPGSTGSRPASRVCRPRTRRRSG